MEEKELKTSTGQRIIICVIAFLMLGSFIAGYALILANSGNSSGSSEEEKISQEKLEEYAKQYQDKLDAFQAATKSDYEKFSQYVSEVTSYDEEAANSGGVVTRDLAEGSGRELTSGDNDYLAYYIGWCADGTVFDSVLDDNTKPTGLTRALDASGGLIDGWNEGVVGMKLGGVRKITIPGDKAYGESRELCGGTSKPLKFIVMAVESTESLKKLSDEVQTADTVLQYAYYGIDYYNQ